MMGTSEKQKTGIKSHLLKLLLAAAFVFSLTILGGGHNEDVQAATKATVKQVDDGATYATIRFNITRGEDISYRMSLSKSGLTNAQARVIGKANDTADTEVDIPNLSAGSSYWIQIGSQSGNDASITWSDPFEIVTCPNITPTNLKQTKAQKTSINVSWKASSGANMYAVSTCKAGETKWSKDTNVTKTNAAFTRLKQGAGYRVAVWPARQSSTAGSDGKKYIAYSYNSNIAYSTKYYPTIAKKPSAPVLTAGYRQTGKANVGVKPQNYVTGYQFQIYDMSTKKVVATTKSTSYRKTISSSKLKKNHVYKVRVRSYVVNTNYHSEWSSYSYFASQKKGTLRASWAVNGIKLSWNKVGGARKYEVYVSTTRDGKYKKAATTTKRSYTITKYGKSPLQSGRRYYYYVAPVTKDGKKYYSTNKNMYYTWSAIYYR
ncbi:MAG: hypothetical protein HFG80_01170 [Eubacterium sp.]|nr:hypothetical protein [Eubacterium sp.]